MKSKSTFLFILMLVLLAVMSAGCTDHSTEYSSTLSTLSLSGKPIPVSFEHRDNPDGLSGSYWVGTAQITGDDTKYTLTLPEGQKSGSSMTKDTISLQLSGINTRWEARIEDDPSPMTYYCIEYFFYDLVWDQGIKPVPYYNLDVNRKLISSANLKVSFPDGQVQSATISNFGTESQVTIPVNGKTIFFKMQGIQLASGDLPPAGDLCVVQKPFLGSQYQLVTRDNLESGVNSYNRYAMDLYFWNKYGWTPDEIDDWTDCYNWMATNGNIPDRSPAVATETQIITGNDAKIIVKYPTTVFAPLVTFYIPEELAGTVTINEQTPEFTFNTIKKITGIEGGSYRLEVTGRALGSGTIRLDASSPAIKSVRWVDGPEKRIVKGTSYTFYGDIEFNTALDADRDFQATIYAIAAGLGTSTQQTFTVYLHDKDTVADTHTVRVYAIYEDSGDKVMSAPLYIGYGSNRLIGYGDSTKTKVIEGTYQIYSETCYIRFTSIKFIRNL
jgi:hypothetical protein